MILLILAFLSIVEGYRECNVFSKFSYVNCNSLGLTVLPLISQKVKEANLRDNSLTEIYGSGYVSLEYLDVSQNQINKINWNPPFLVHLNVSRNPLRKVLLKSETLEQLDVSRCLLNFLYKDFFEGIPNLMELYISDNPLKTIHDNDLYSLISQGTLLRSLPYMPMIHHLEVSRNPQLETIIANDTIRILKASECNLNKVVLNKDSTVVDLSKNKLNYLKLSQKIEVLNVSWNLLRSIDLDREYLKEVDLSNNFLRSVQIKTKHLEKLFVFNNHIQDLTVYCNACYIDCAYCQLKKMSFYNVKFLNVSYNNLESVITENIKEIDARHNLLTEFKSTADFFDVRHNSLSDLNKFSITGKGYLTKNPWPCDCSTLKQLQSAMKETRLCDDPSLRQCFVKTAGKMTKPFVISLVLLVFTIVSIALLRMWLQMRRNSTGESGDEATGLNDLPTYEEALRMKKPNWTRGESSERQGNTQST